ncbi:MAG: hypothetical protein QOF89_762 [Acidobacteriota bacterium]|jgi:hypothetical protein|nr:hypothetical protein [Acidobacteriota bacterium]
MSRRRYRVVKRLPWIEGGKPAPPPVFWEGGEGVTYEPGDIVEFEEEDLPGIYRRLEALDDAGRAAIEELRAQEGAQIIAVADFPEGFGEHLGRALRREDSWEEERIERTYAVLADGTMQQSMKVHPANPLPGVVYDDYGVPLPFDTAIEQRRLKMERELGRIHSGGNRGRRRGRETKRDETARADEALLSAVREYRAKHPDHGRPAIAAALVDDHGRQIDHADPTDRKRAIAALVKHIERLEKR